MNNSTHNYALEIEESNLLQSLEGLSKVINSFESSANASYLIKEKEQLEQQLNSLRILKQ